MASKDKLCELLRRAEKNSIFVGDFNLPGVNWDSGEARGEDERVVQELQENNLTQLVDFQDPHQGGVPRPDHHQHTREGEQRGGSR